MSTPFESVARVAIAEIIRNHAQESKFGLVVTTEQFDSLCDELFDLLNTSRKLKAAGDRFLAAQMTPPATSPRPLGKPRNF